MKLRLSKCTQYKNEAILWQVDILGEEKNKVYLMISHHKENGKYLHFLREKPGRTWDASGGFSSLVRKYIPTAILESILIDPEHNSLWLPLQTQGQNWLLHIQHEGAVEISLISPDSSSLVRLGSKGLFTKKKELSELPSLISLQDKLFEYLSSLSEKKQEVSLPKNPQDTASHFQREARKRLSRKLKTVRVSFAKLSQGVFSDQEIAGLEKQARLLQSFIHKVVPHAEVLLLNKEETGEESLEEIPLNPELSAVENLSDFFDRLKKMKRGRKILAEQVEKVKGELESLESENLRLLNEKLSDGEILFILKKFRLSIDKPASSSQGSVDDKSIKPYKVFKSGNIDILVGKGSQENDEMTKFARSNDYWFHAIGMGGSHVLISYHQLSQGKLTEKLKRDACILALHFSRLRKDRAGDVYVTQRRHLSKKKGMAPGLWQVLKSETVYLSYTEEELKPLLHG